MFAVKPESLFKELIFTLPKLFCPVPPLAIGNIPVTSSVKSTPPDFIVTTPHDRDWETQVI